MSDCRHNSLWRVYMIECRGNRLYVGMTLDVQRRLRQHCAGSGAKFTRAFPPEQGQPPLYVSPEMTRAHAAALEAALKRMSHKAKMTFACTRRPSAS